MKVITKSATALILGLILPLSTLQAETKAQVQDTLNSLNASIASAELAIALVEAEEAIREVKTAEAINHLSALIADAELSLSIASANEAIRTVRGQEAINSMLADIADFDLTLAIADASEVINKVDDSVMLAELNGVLENSDITEANSLIMAVVAERPMLAAAIQDMALTAGYSEAMVATAVVSGLGSAAATAAGE